MANKRNVEVRVCTPVSLPERLLVRAAETARKVFPVNAPSFALATSAPGVDSAAVLDPLQIAVLTTKYWGPAPRKLSVSFLERAPRDLQQRILTHMNAWSRRCGIGFALASGTGQVRITLRGDGYWSYLGTDILHIPRNRPTMSLEGFSMQTPEAEYKRVVRHETGHTLGFPHEHMRRELVELLDPEKTVRYFWEQYRWDRETVTQQVLTPLDDSSLMATPADADSIMCYQLPGDCTRSGEPIPGGLDIDESDYAFAERIYPRGRGRAVQVVQAGEEPDEPEDPGAAARQHDWPEEEDEEVDVTV